MNLDLSQEKTALAPPKGASALWIGSGPSRDLPWAAPGVPQAGHIELITKERWNKLQN